MPHEEPPALPPGLDLLWGRRASSRRGPKPGLSVEVITDVAMRIADAEGLEAVSMARVANTLGFTTMSLYRYIESKEQLLQLMWNASAQGAERFVAEGDSWRDRLRMWALVQREVLDRHRWITDMPMAAPPLRPNSLIFVERGLETLAGTGLDDGDKLRVLGLLSSYTLSEARMAHDAARAARAAEQAPAHPATRGKPGTAGAGGKAATESRGGKARTGGAEAVVSFRSLLRALVSEETYPLLYGIAWSSEPGTDSVEADEHEQFMFGIERILDGVQALIDHERP